MPSLELASLWAAGDMALNLSVMLPVFGVLMVRTNRIALPFLSRWNLEFFSANSNASRSRLGTAYKKHGVFYVVLNSFCTIHTIEICWQFCFDLVSNFFNFQVSVIRSLELFGKKNKSNKGQKISSWKRCDAWQLTCIQRKKCACLHGEWRRSLFWWSRVDKRRLCALQSVGRALNLSPCHHGRLSWGDLGRGVCHFHQLVPVDRRCSRPLYYILTVDAHLKSKHTNSIQM